MSMSATLLDEEVFVRQEISKLIERYQANTEQLTVAAHLQARLRSIFNEESMSSVTNRLNSSALESIRLPSDVSNLNYNESDDHFIRLRNIIKVPLARLAISMSSPDFSAVSLFNSLFYIECAVLLQDTDAMMEGIINRLKDAGEALALTVRNSPEGGSTTSCDQSEPSSDSSTPDQSFRCWGNNSSTHFTPLGNGHILIDQSPSSELDDQEGYDSDCGNFF